MTRVNSFLAVMFVLCVAVAFIAAPAFCQTSQPAVSIIAPPNGATLSGSQVEITVSFVSDENHPVGRIRVFLDGANVTERILDVPSVSGTASFRWDTTRTPNGRHQIDVQGFSSAGDYLGMSTCVVMVLNKPADYNAPKVSIVNLKEGEIVSGVKTISIAASDDSGADPIVSVFIDNSLKSVSNSKPYEYDWDTTKHENGPHTIAVKATDEASNLAETKPLKVIVRNAAAPSVTAQSASSPVISVKVAESPAASGSTPIDKSTNVSNESARVTTPATQSSAPTSVAKVEKPAPAAPAKTVTPKPASVKVEPVGNAVASAKTSVPTQAAASEKVTVSKPVTVTVLPGMDKKSSEDVAKSEPKASDVKMSNASDKAIGTAVTAKEPASKQTVPAKVEVSKSKLVTTTPKVEAKPTVIVKEASEIKASPKPTTKSSGTQVADSRKDTVKVSQPAQPVNAVKPAKQNDVVVQAPASPEVRSRVVNPATLNEKSYVVQAGDNISKIASVFGVSPDKIIALNNIQDPNLIVEGQKLILPEDAKMVRIRTVVERVGGTLEWNAKAKTVRAVCAQSELKVKIGSDKATLNNEQVKMEKKASIHKGRTIVPKSIVTKALSN